MFSSKNKKNHKIEKEEEEEEVRARKTKGGALVDASKGGGLLASWVYTPGTGEREGHRGGRWRSLQRRHNQSGLSVSLEREIS